MQGRCTANPLAARASTTSQSCPKRQHGPCNEKHAALGDAPVHEQAPAGRLVEVKVKVDQVEEVGGWAMVAGVDWGMEVVEGQVEAEGPVEVEGSLVEEGTPVEARESLAVAGAVMKPTDSNYSYGGKNAQEVQG